MSVYYINMLYDQWRSRDYSLWRIIIITTKKQNPNVHFYNVCFIITFENILLTLKMLDDILQ